MTALQLKRPLVVIVVTSKLPLASVCLLFEALRGPLKTVTRCFEPPGGPDVILQLLGVQVVQFSKMIRGVETCALDNFHA